VFLAADTVVLALRALTFVAIFQAVGNALFVDLFGARLSARVEERVRTLARIAAVAALCLAVGHYMLMPAWLAGNLGQTFDTSLSELVRESDAGTAHIVRIVGLAVLFLSLDRRTRLNTIAMRVAVALTLVSFALMGHTVIHPLRWLLAPLLLVHVGVAAFWFGALWPLHEVAAREPAERGAAAIAAYTRLATRLVPAVLICGALIALVFIRSVADLATAYGALVLGKALAFGVLMYLAAQNKRRYVPGGTAAGPGDMRAFQRTAVAEWSVLAVVLVATALMTALYAPEHLEGGFGSHLLEHSGAAAPEPGSAPRDETRTDTASPDRAPRRAADATRGGGTRENGDRPR
jgi:putative copper export protein